MRTVRIYNQIAGIFEKGHERSIKAKRQILYSFGLKGISILIGLILVPLLLDYLDSERYGIWLILSSVLGWFSFFDIGLGNGLRNKFTEATSKGDQNLARIYVSTTYGMLIIIFSIVLLFFYFLNPFLNWASILNTSLIPSGELSILALIVLTFFILRFIFKIIGIILMADQRPAENNALEPISNIIILVTILVLKKISPEGSLIALGSVLSSVPVLILIVVSFILFKGRYKAYRPSLKWFNTKYTKELMRLGSRFFIISISFVIFYATSNIIITQVLGPQEVTVYNIAYKYFSVPVMAYAIIMSPIWSAVTEAYTKDDFSWLKNTLRKLNIASVIFVVGILSMVLISNQVYRLWVGDRVQVPFVLSAIMALNSIINVVISPFSQFLNGCGKLKLNTFLVIFQSIFYIPLAVFLTKTSLGAAGTVLALCLISGISMFFQPLQTYKILNKRAFGVWNE